MAVDRNPSHLHPIFAKVLGPCLNDLARAKETGETKTLFKLYEGYRAPKRQFDLFANTKSTKARPWQSAHQYGLAADIVPMVDGHWSWDPQHDWQFMRATARKHGLLTPIDWDLAHLEHPLMDSLRELGFTARR